VVDLVHHLRDLAQTAGSAVDVEELPVAGALALAVGARGHEALQDEVEVVDVGLRTQSARGEVFAAGLYTLDGNQSLKLFKTENGNYVVLDRAFSTC
jgi:hypothetical protein